MLKPKDDPKYTEATIPPLVIAGVIDYGNKNNMFPERWIMGTGLTMHQLYLPDTLISFRQAAIIIRRALREFPKSALGLHLGYQTGLVSFGMLGFAMLSCRNMREAFEVGVKHHQAAGSLIDAVAEITAIEAALKLEARFFEPDILPFLCEEVFSSSFALFKLLNPAVTSAHRVELTYPPPIYAQEYSQFFNCPIHFNSPANKLVFDTVLLEHPISTYSPSSFSTALAVCHQMIQASDVTYDLVGSIKRILLESLPVRLSMVEVARQLNLTERTLRRNLTEANESFSAIRDRVLEKQARSLLVNSTLSLTAISNQLGFNDLRDFRRAFQRWTGMTPSSFRHGI
ncbi:AraC family transcriptional regulator [Acinetobacter sp. WZC-1]|uniref:AraC family transcriptional regulator n=1 Tax=Acinetobacter sp. WZC-1 TaxID=3459034 RepID=UPI00403E3256